MKPDFDWIKKGLFLDCLKLYHPIDIFLDKSGTFSNGAGSFLDDLDPFSNESEPSSLRLDPF